MLSVCSLVSCGFVGLDEVKMVAVVVRSRVAGAWLRCVCVCLCVFVFICVPAPRQHVLHTWAWCRYTRGRFERTHMFFSVSHHTPRPHTYTTTTATATATPTQPQWHTTSLPQRHRTTRNQPNNNTNQPTCGSICLNTGKLTRSRHSEN